MNAPLFAMKEAGDHSLKITDEEPLTMKAIGIVHAWDAARKEKPFDESEECTILPTATPENFLLITELLQRVPEHDEIDFCMVLIDRLLQLNLREILKNPLHDAALNKISEERITWIKLCLPGFTELSLKECPDKTYSTMPEIAPLLPHATDEFLAETARCSIKDLIEKIEADKAAKK
jgi:hypothetical protein